MPVDLATTVHRACPWLNLRRHHVRLAIRVQATTRSPHLAVLGTIRTRWGSLHAKSVWQGSTVRGLFQRRIPTVRWCVLQGTSVFWARHILSPVRGEVSRGIRAYPSAYCALRGILASSQVPQPRISARQGTIAGRTTHHRSLAPVAHTATGQGFARSLNVCYARPASTVGV